jgi:hypothetical protein
MSEKILGSISCRQNLDLKELRSQSFRPQFQNGRKCCLLTGNPRSLARAMNTDSAHSPRSFLSLIIRSPSCHPPPTPLLPASSCRNKIGENVGTPLRPECGRTGDFRQRRLISLLEFSDKPGASKFREKCRKHSQNGKSMEHYRQFRRPSGMRLRFSHSPGVETPGYCQWSLRDLPCPTTSTTPRFFVP